MAPSFNMRVLRTQDFGASCLSSVLEDWFALKDRKSPFSFPHRKNEKESESTLGSCHERNFQAEPRTINARRMHSLWFAVSFRKDALDLYLFQRIWYVVKPKNCACEAVCRRHEWMTCLGNSLTTKHKRRQQWGGNCWTTATFLGEDKDWRWFIS